MILTPLQQQKSPHFSNNAAILTTLKYSHLGEQQGRKRIDSVPPDSKSGPLSYMLFWKGIYSNYDQ